MNNAQPIWPAGRRRSRGASHPNLLAESFDPLETAASAFAAPDGRWRVEAHFRARPALADLRALVASAADKATAAALTLERVAARDWVAQSLEGLKPVLAGRFVVHGAHDRDHAPPHRIGVEIEAAQAFGTGHHGTTRGCLLALDETLRHRRPRYTLDIGTGSGVLAIAAALALHRPVLATDIDPTSVRIARDNARRNRAGALVTALHANGVQARQIAARAVRSGVRQYPAGAAAAAGLADRAQPDARARGAARAYCRRRPRGDRGRAYGAAGARATHRARRLDDVIDGGGDPR